MPKLLSAALAVLAGALALPPAASAVPLFAIDTKGRLLSFDSTAPVEVAVKRLTGLPRGVAVRGLDMRPRTGQLWILGSDSKLYTATRGGKVTAVSTAPFATPLAGKRFGFDFNPMVDRIRIVSDTEQNLRANPLTGGLVQADKPLTPAADVTAAAYTSSGRATANATATTLFVIDGRGRKLYIQNPPNDGVLSAPVNLSTALVSQVHFDIVGATDEAFVTGRTAGSKRTRLFSLDLRTGELDPIGNVGSGKLGLQGLTGRPTS